MIELGFGVMSRVTGLLSIAGYDPSGGAGILLDIRVFEQLGFRGAGVLTAVTAQNASRVEAVFPLSGRLVRRQFEALAVEARIAGIKVGMTASLENLAAAVRILAAHSVIPRVVDPVFRSSSGAPLLERRGIERFLGLLRGRASLVTPNLEEASVLAAVPVKTAGDMKEAARRIHGASGVPCLVKGGHLADVAVDLLFDGMKFTAFRHARVEKSVHGSGCFLSAAILAYLAAGCSLEEACRRAVALTVRAIRKAVTVHGGRAVFSFPS
jgi:hydroxymethylpyrimidine/phosphomethylpyrimidine kinase